MQEPLLLQLQAALLCGSEVLLGIQIRVTAHADLSDVVVYDRFGAELMIEGISVGTPKYDPFDTTSCTCLTNGMERFT